LGRVDSIAEDYNKSVEEYHIAQVGSQLRQQDVDYNTEYRKRNIIVNSNIGIVLSEDEDQTKQAKQHCGQDEDEHLPFDIDDFSSILVVLILGFFVQIIQF